MFSIIPAVVLLLVTLTALTLRKTYYYLPEAELKRQARSGDKLAKTLYRAVAYGADLRLLLWSITGISAAVGLELFVRFAPMYLGIVVVAIVLWLGFAWMPSTKLTRYGARLTVWCTPSVVWLLRKLNPVFSRLTAQWHKRFPLPNHTGMYEREDLSRLIKRQAAQPDNRVLPEVLELMHRALKFDEYTVSGITVPHKAVKAVGKNDAVGPIFLDELHATGFTRFPVYDKSPDEIVGTLHLITLDEAKEAGHVRDFMDSHVAYLHEDDNLADALQAVYTTKQQLFVVINTHGEYVGIATLEDMLQSLFGALAVSDFDAHHDREAVAAKHTAVPEPVEAEEEKLPETPETVVE